MTAGVDRQVVRHDAGGHAIELARGVGVPDLGAQQAQGHLRQPVIEMHQHHVIPAARQVVVKDNRAHLAGVRMRQALGAACPTAAQGRQVEDRAGCALAGGVGPDALDRGLTQRRQAGQFECDRDGRLDVLRRQIERVPGFLHLLAQPVDARRPGLSQT